MYKGIKLVELCLINIFVVFRDKLFLLNVYEIFLYILVPPQALHIYKRNVPALMWLLRGVQVIVYCVYTAP